MNSANGRPAIALFTPPYVEIDHQQAVDFRTSPSLRSRCVFGTPAAIGISDKIRRRPVRAGFTSPLRRPSA